MKNILKELDKFFSGYDTKTGEQFFNKWFDSFDDSRGYLDELAPREKEQHKQQIFQNIQQETTSEPQDTVSLGSHFPGSFSSAAPLIPKIAAILIVGLLLSVSGYFFYHMSNSDPKRGGMIQNTTVAGEIKKIILPDGSKVWLSAKSSLQYPQNFTSSHRSVQLEGEAFFEVKTDSTSPFLVDAGALQTRVLGTSFNIKAYPDDRDIAVTLATGKVEVSDSSHSTTDAIILHPDQQVLYLPKTGFSKIKQTDASAESAWRDGELVFKRVSFTHIAKTFERWYDVEFIFDDPSHKEEVFVYHFKELSLSQSMEILSKLADFEYTITENQVIIR